MYVFTFILLWSLLLQQLYGCTNTLLLFKGSCSLSQHSATVRDNTYCGEAVSRRHNIRWFLLLNFSFLLSSYVLTAGSPATVWPTVLRPSETKRWAAASATAVAPRSTKSRGVELKWTQPWVRTMLWMDDGSFHIECFTNAELLFPLQVITRMPSASSVVRRDTCQSPALITPKDSTLKVLMHANSHCVSVPVYSSPTKNVPGSASRRLLSSLWFSGTFSEGLS